MPSTARDGADAPLAVAVGVLEDARGRWLLARRPAGRAWAGHWEFPGGKRTAGEGALTALRRELAEELGIEVTRARRLTRCRFRYPAATVDLDVWRVRGWRGEPRPLEQQVLCWASPRQAARLPLLPANRHIVRALELPALYLITGPCRGDPEHWLARLACCLEAGVRLVYLRDRALDAPSLERLTRRAVALARRHGARVLVGAPPDRALAWGADGAHLSAAELRRLAAAGCRRPGGGLLAASCHDQAELTLAERLGADFAVLSPVCPTASHPQTRPLGWERLRALAASGPLPVYALGGMTPASLPAAWDAGAVGVAMLGGVWQAADPDAVVSRCLALERDWALAG